MRKFSTTAVLITAIALLAFFAPYLFRSASEAGLKYLVTALQIAWFAGLIWSIRFGKRSLWLFTTAPLALFWPWGVLVVMTIGCHFESCDWTMLVFFWVLASMGVAYGAKISGRNAFAWFVIALAATPLLGSAALITANRYGW